MKDADGTVHVYDSSGAKAGDIYFSSEKDKAVGYISVRPGTYTVEEEYKEYLKDYYDWIKEEDENEVEEPEQLDYLLEFQVH